MGVHGVDWPALPLRSAGFPFQSLPLDIRLLVIGTAPLVYLALCFFFVDPVPFLDTSDQLVFVPTDHVEIVIRELAPAGFRRPRSWLCEALGVACLTPLTGRAELPWPGS